MQFEFAGELSLAGELRPVRGALALALALQAVGQTRTFVLPEAGAAEAARADAGRVCGAPRLLAVVRALLSGEAGEPPPLACPPPQPVEAMDKRPATPNGL